MSNCVHSIPLSGYCPDCIAAIPAFLRRQSDDSVTGREAEIKEAISRCRDEQRIATLTAQLATMREALLVLLDQIDYMQGNCWATEMMAACLDKAIIQKARKALFEEPPK